jgi:hypothetical protein
MGDLGQSVRSDLARMLRSKHFWLGFMWGAVTMAWIVGLEVLL